MAIGERIRFFRNLRGMNNLRNIITATLTVTNMTSGATIIQSMMKLPVL